MHKAIIQAQLDRLTPCIRSASPGAFLNPSSNTSTSCLSCGYDTPGGPTKLSLTSTSPASLIPPEDALRCLRDVHCSETPLRKVGRREMEVKPMRVSTDPAAP